MVESATHLNKLGLREQPFAPTADPSYFYASADHKSCLHRLWGTIDERHGIAVVLGNYGTGKTTLLRKLMTGMAADPEKYNTAIIGSPIPSWTSFALFEAIISQFGLTPAKRSFVSYMECLNKYLLDNRQWISTLIIDDAQNLNKRGQLELLRLAQNLETPQHKLLNLLLFAQLEWTPILQAAPNFTQRINMIYTLEPLQFGEVKRFIQFRVARARGGVEGAPLYEDAAIEMSSSEFLEDRLAVLFEVTPTFGTFDTSEDALDLCFLMTEDSTVLTPAGLPSSALEENQRFLGSPISPAAILCERWMNHKRDAVVDFARSDAGPAYARKIVYYAEGGKPQQYMDMLWNVQATVDWNSGSVPTSDK